MKTELTITAKPRLTRGKNEARRLRVQGLTPAIVYGAGQESVAVAVNPKEVAKILHSGSGFNTIFYLSVDGEHTPVMIVDHQNDPIRDSLLHVDLKRIDLTKPIEVKIPIIVTGEPKGVKLQGGLLEVIKREIEIECLPNEIPEHFTVDVTELMIGQNVRAGAIPLAANMTLISPKEQVIAHVIAMRVEEVEPAAADAATAVAPTTAEPEVIKKGKKEEEAPADEKKKK
jgi:large subunit ribosomal protein L25